MFYKQGGKLVSLGSHFCWQFIIGGTPEEVKWCQESLKQRFNITELVQVKKHLGVWYEWKKDKEGNTFIEASMHKMVEQIVKDYEKKAGGLPKAFSILVYQVLPYQSYQMEKTL